MALLKSTRLNEDRACRFRRIKGAGFRLAMEVTRRCNLSCQHCFVQLDQNQPTLEELRDVIGQAKQLGCRKLIITGGEPLLRKDLEKIIKIAVGSGLLVDLNSNLFRLTRQRVNALKAAGLQEASVSLYGGREIHDALTQHVGAFDSTLRGIELIRDAGMTVDVHGAVWNDMLPYLPKLVDTIQKRGVSSVTFFSLIPGNRSGNAIIHTYSPALVMKAVSRIREFAAIPVRTVGLCPLQEGECVQGNGIFGIGADMRLKPCLLSEHTNNQEGIDLYSCSLKTAISLLSKQILECEWRAACNPSVEMSHHA